MDWNMECNRQTSLNRRPYQTRLNVEINKIEFSECWICFTTFSFLEVNLFKQSILTKTHELIATDSALKMHGNRHESMGCSSSSDIFAINTQPAYDIHSSPWYRWPIYRNSWFIDLPMEKNGEHFFFEPCGKAQTSHSEWYWSFRTGFPGHGRSSSPTHHVSRLSIDIFWWLGPHRWWFHHPKKIRSSTTRSFDDFWRWFHGFIWILMVNTG